MLTFAQAFLALHLAAVPASAPTPCPGPTTAAVAATLPPQPRHRFEGLALPAFDRLWAKAARPPCAVAPDAVLAVPTTDATLTIIFSRKGCALGVLEVRRSDLLRALRADVGPTI
jgi:hypothetical protein